MVACTSYCHDICQNSQNAFTNSEKEKRKIIFKKTIIKQNKRIGSRTRVLSSYSKNNQSESHIR
jgi:hypothetical protein